VLDLKELEEQESDSLGMSVLRYREHTVEIF
jgi:hypothetical protein